MSISCGKVLQKSFMKEHPGATALQLKRFTLLTLIVTAIAAHTQKPRVALEPCETRVYGCE